MTITQRSGLFAICLLAAGTASAQKAEAPKVPQLDRSFVQHLRAPGALDLRSKALLVDELARLERLLRITPKKSPDRPLLVRRLAEGYAELAAIAAREKALAEARLRRAQRAAPAR